MKHIFVNFKRFDVPAQLGGVNRIAPIETWAENIIRETRTGIRKLEGADTEFVMFFPEAHILNAVRTAGNGLIQIGCQSVFREDVAKGGNFGAFTTSLPAAAARALGCKYTLIGHCEERNNYKGIMKEAGVEGKAASEAVNRILNREILAAQKQGLRVLYCIGETSEEQPQWETVLSGQIKDGLTGVDLSTVTIGYEPVWSIGPGKTPAGRDYIQKIARFVKERTGGIDVVYGGGLKKDNAAMLASIPEIDGGLIALTRFSGEIGFYPEEYLEIADLYLNAAQ